MGSEVEFGHQRWNRSWTWFTLSQRRDNAMCLAGYYFLARS